MIYSIELQSIQWDYWWLENSLGWGRLGYVDTNIFWPIDLYSFLIVLLKSWILYDLTIYMYFCSHHETEKNIPFDNVLFSIKGISCLKCLHKRIIWFIFLLPVRLLLGLLPWRLQEVNHRMNIWKSMALR